MAVYYLVPVCLDFQRFTNAGAILAGGKIKTYLAGTSTPQATFTTSAGSVSNGAVLTLDANGRLTTAMWVLAGVALKIELTDSANNVLLSIDNVSGINDVSAAFGSPGPIGAVTPSTGVYTTLQATTFNVTTINGVTINVSGSSTLGDSNTVDSTIINSMVAIGRASLVANVQCVVQGQGATSGTNAFQVQNSTGSTAGLSMYIRDDGGWFSAIAGGASGAPFNNTTATPANLFINTSGGIQKSTSSRKYKHAIEDAVWTFSDLLSLRPVTFKGNNDGERVFGGFIAEEVHDIPSLRCFVNYAEDGSPDGLHYATMTAAIVAGLKEYVTATEARLAALEAR